MAVLCQLLKTFLDWLKATAGAHKCVGMTYLWVDAICIDKVDITEKNARVQQMWQHT